MEKNYFAVDLGATSGRTILGTLSDKGVELQEINRFSNHLIQVGQHYYWDIYALYRHIVDGLKLVSSRGISISSIGIDTWGVDFVCLGKDGDILRQPYSYRDPQTNGAPETLFQRLSSAEVYRKTGIQIMNFNSIFQLDTLRRNQDSAYQAADKILFMPDALSYMLTGEKVTEYTIASTSQLVNAQTRALDADLLEVIGLSASSFGRLVFPGEKIGELTEDIQQMTGLGAIPVIAVAGHDTASAVAAVPATTSNFAYLSSGTWSLMGVEVNEPIINKETERLNFTNEGGVEGTIRLLKNICGMWLLERCRLVWGDVSYPDLITEAEASEAFRSLIHPDEACFANPNDMIEAIKAYCQQTNQPVPEQRGQIVRCIFESLALRYREVLDHLKELAPYPIEVLHVIGGGSRNELLNQFTANALSIPVIAGPSEATALGNVMIQAISSGEAKDVASSRQLIYRSISLKRYNPENHSSWEVAYNQYKQVKLIK